MKAKVFLNVYDLSKNNKYVYPFGFGVYHSGIELFGVEYAFGGHEYDFSGVFQTTPRVGPPGVEFRESIEMGIIEMTRVDIQNLMVALGEKYTGRSYNLLLRNCNHFADELIRILCNRGIPKWVNRLANMGAWMPCLIDTTTDAFNVPVAPATRLDQNQVRPSTS